MQEKRVPEIYPAINPLKRTALNRLETLYENNRLSLRDFELFREVISKIDLLRDRDEYLEDLWWQLEDIPMNPETECIDAPFFIWSQGTHREEIWHWFDKRYSRGVAALVEGR